MTKEAVARQFFYDFIENSGAECECGQDQVWSEEECNMILTSCFFSGRLEISWNRRKHSLILNFLEKQRGREQEAQMSAKRVRR